MLIKDIAKRVAELKGVDVAEVEYKTTENVKKLFVKMADCPKT